MPLNEQHQDKTRCDTENILPKAGPGVVGAGGFQRRGWPRTRVIKSAKLLLCAHRLLDCVVLDESAGGVMIDLRTMALLPDNMIIQFSNGASFPVRLCWVGGSKAGLVFTGSQIIREDSAERMRNIADILQNQGIPATVETLRTVRFFDNPALRHAAEEAEASQARFKAILLGRAGLG